MIFQVSVCTHPHLELLYYYYYYYYYDAANFR